MSVGIVNVLLLVSCLFPLLSSEMVGRFILATDWHRSKCPLDTSCNSVYYAHEGSLATEENGTDDKEICCGKCSCESHCFDFGTCCLGMYTTFEHGQRVISDSRYECLRLQYLSESEYSRGALYWMVTKCSQQGVDKMHEKLCENPGLNDNIESILPVSNPDLSVHYRSKYCAFCNGQYDINTVDRWKLEILCDEVISLADPNLLTKLQAKSCNIFYRPPLAAKLRDCTHWPSYHISTCNETGLWSSYDPIVQAACDSFVDPFNYTYKNFFCYLCNSRPRLEVDDWKCILDDPSQIHDLSPPFFALLDIDQVKRLKDDSPNLGCDPIAQFEDHKLSKCHDILCDETRYLGDENCELKSGVTETVCYEVFLKLIPINLSLTNFLQNESVLFSSIENALGILDEVIINKYIFPESKGYVLLYLVFDLTLSTSQTVTLENIEDLHNNIMPINTIEGLRSFRSELGLYNMTRDKDVTKIYVTGQNGFGTMDIIYSSNKVNNSCFAKTTLAFDKLLTCPFIAIKFEELSMKVENDWLSIQGNSRFRKLFSRREYRFTKDGILICLSDYQPIYNALPTRVSQRELSLEQVGTKRILSFVCVCSSILCLLVTIVTYLFLSDLQSQPGINNIILCICLLLAQMVYQFGAGQRSLSDAACSLIGAISHFLWLSVMFSMNACSVQMFMIFKNHIKLSPRFNKLQTLITILYITGSSLLFVLINLSVSYSSDSGIKSGYGGLICYIRSSTMHLVTFIIPTLILLSVNLLLFSYVLYRMRKFKKASAKLHQERNYLGINARLSTLTGLTWLFGFLQILVRQDVVEYLFIVFNSSQGVFIMIAFVCNQRVWSLMFKKRLPMSSEQGVNTEKTLNQN